jgi:hypothetical protein
VSSNLMEAQVLPVLSVRFMVVFPLEDASADASFAQCDTEVGDARVRGLDWGIKASLNIP